MKRNIVLISVICAMIIAAIIGKHLHTRSQNIDKRDTPESMHGLAASWEKFVTEELAGILVNSPEAMEVPTCEVVNDFVDIGDKRLLFRHGVCFDAQGQDLFATDYKKFFAENGEVTVSVNATKVPETTGDMTDYRKTLFRYWVIGEGGAEAIVKADIAQLADEEQRTSCVATRKDLGGNIVWSAEPSQAMLDRANAAEETLFDVCGNFGPIGSWREARELNGLLVQGNYGQEVNVYVDPFSIAVKNI